jgi:hypothetical protein
MTAEGRGKRMQLVSINRKNHEQAANTGVAHGPPARRHSIARPCFVTILPFDGHSGTR